MLTDTNEVIGNEGAGGVAMNTTLDALGQIGAGGTWAEATAEIIKALKMTRLCGDAIFMDRFLPILGRSLPAEQKRSETP